MKKIKWLYDKNKQKIIQLVLSYNFTCFYVKQNYMYYCFSIVIHNLMQQKWIYEDSRGKLAQFLLSIADDDMEKILDDIMTPQEIIELHERLSIFRDLEQWLSQRKIAEKLGISITTVNRWSRVLQFWTGMIKKYIA